MYLVTYLKDYEGNMGEPLESKALQFPTKEEALKKYNELVSEENKEQGTFALISLIDNTDPYEPDLLKEDLQPSTPLPENAVLVFFRNHNWINYAYRIQSVRFKYDTEKDISHLPYDIESTAALWCRWFENIDEFIYEYEKRKAVPFNKIYSGEKIIEEFILKHK